MDDPKSDDLRVGFDSRLKLRFFDSKVTTDAGLLACRELNEALGLIEMGAATTPAPNTGGECCCQ